MTNTAKDKAEDLLHTVQNKARELVDAEEGLIRTVRDLIEEKGLNPADVRKRLDETVGQLKSNELFERVRKSETVVALSDYRDELEGRVEETMQRFLATLQLATLSDLKGLEAELKSLKRKVTTLTKQVKELKNEAA